MREWLYAIRKARKLTLEEVARQTGLSIASIARYENGERTPKPYTAKRVADFFGVDWRRFYE